LPTPLGARPSLEKILARGQQAQAILSQERQHRQAERHFDVRESLRRPR
jgi:hypothetical protein